MSRPKLLPEQAWPQTPQPSPHLTLKPQASRILLRLTTTSRTTGLVILLVLSRAIVAMCTPLDILTMATIRRSLSCWLLTGKLGLSRGYTARGLLLLAQTIMQTEMPEVTTIMITSTALLFWTLYIASQAHWFHKLRKPGLVRDPGFSPSYVVFGFLIWKSCFSQSLG